jgi:superfamily II DNA or RNA helicase
MTIHIFNSPAGAGKTHALALSADRLARRGQKVLFIQPTIHLINKTIQEELIPLEPPYSLRAIHGDADLTTNSVVADIVIHFQNAVDGEGEVLFITHPAFLRVPYFERKDRWVLVMDEVPQVDVYDELTLTETHDLITPHLTLVAEGAVYGRLIAKEDLAR